MINIYFIRHGQTQWNSDKKLQGRTDIPLNAAGRAQIAAYQLNEQLKAAKWYCSPLQRAQQTAAILGVNPSIEEAFIEMNWGAWEGRKLKEIQRADPDEFARLEALGIDLMPPQAESPRIVGARVNEWVEQLAAQSASADIGCVSHKGVIRAVYALAANWDMKNKAEHKMDFHCAQHFCFENGVWSIGALNIAL